MSNGRVRTIQTIGAAGAQAAVAAAEREARANGWALSIAVVDVAGDLLAFHRMDGISPVSIDVAIAKARTVARFGAPSKRLQDSLEQGQFAVLAIPGVTPLGGGVPILINKVMIGAVATSGGTVEQDVQAAKAGAAAALAE